MGVLGVTAMDILKTILMYVFWTFYQVGVIHDIFERLPTVWTRVAVALVIHGILDVIQTLAVVFTMWVAEAVAELNLNGNCNRIDGHYYTQGNPGKDVNNSERDLLWSFTGFLLEADDEWCTLLFGKTRRSY